MLLQRPGQPPPGFKQVVGHFTVGVEVAVGVGPVGVAVGVGDPLGLGVGPLITGAGGIVTEMGSPSGDDVGIAVGVTSAKGVGN